MVRRLASSRSSHEAKYHSNPAMTPQAVKVSNATPTPVP